MVKTLCFGCMKQFEITFLLDFHETDPLSWIQRTLDWELNALIQKTFFSWGQRKALLGGELGSFST